MPDRRNIPETVRIREAREDEIFTVIAVLGLVLGLWLLMMNGKNE